MADASRANRLAIWLASVALVVAIVALAIVVLRDDSTTSAPTEKASATTVPYKVPKGSRLVGEKTITVTKDGQQVVVLGPIDTVRSGSGSRAVAVEPASRAIQVKTQQVEWSDGQQTSVRIPLVITGVKDDPEEITVRAIVTP